MASTSASPQNLAHSALSIVVDDVETQAGSTLLLPQSELAAEYGAWDIFLSHSRAEKGFAKGLNHRLNPLYNVFFDLNRPSLPLAEDFPSRILHAARTCRLALVVVSNKFFCSKWPMIELSAFIDAGVKIFPLFYGLSPNDLKDRTGKPEKWRRRWEGFASRDRRIKVSSWVDAFQKLRSTNGLIFRKSDGELAFLEEIESAIYGMIPPLIKSSHAGIHGRARLCKVFIDKFEELERRPPGLKDSLSKVYLLGVYGLPGSGKSTLSGCLCEWFFCAFSGRVLHLKLPTDPTPTELLGSAKQLLKLTNYAHHREEMMSNIADLPQMFSILKASNLRSSRVFLVIDNISSQESIESVEAFLQLGVGAGSRVMLVARSLWVLRTLLDNRKYGHGHIHYVCNSMGVPSLNEKEAIRVLMQPADGLGSASNDIIKMEGEYYTRHRGIIVKLAHMCAFSPRPAHCKHQDLLFVPLVLKMVGSQLRSEGMDLEMWERQGSQFATILVEESKEDAVRTMVEESFQKLQAENLRLVFLDVALFLVPYMGFGGIEYEAAVELLSFMHDCDPDTIKRRIAQLLRLCFLELDFLNLKKFIAVHDVFLEFIRSNMADASSMYYCSGRTKAGAQFMSHVCSTVRNAHAELRAFILEVDEECERFDFPAGLSRVKVVIVRNSDSLASLGLAGLLSLVILVVEGCPRLRRVELDPCHAYTLKCLKWVKQHGLEDTSDQQLQGGFLQSLQSLVQKLLQAGSGVLEDNKRLILKRDRHGMWAFSGGYWPPRPSGAMSPAERLKGLQVLE